jgi:mannose-6-phosphate isomerase-like protein (cupin superfamily)
MSERIFTIHEKVSEKDKTSMKVLFRSEIHEIHLWRVTPGEWVYPHIHPHNDDIWHIIQGIGKYYLTSQETKTVEPGEIALAKPGEVHGIFNSGNEDIIIYSILSPLPIEIEPAQGFEYPI